ncbi:MAG: Rieske 2Fe-2S domain-containing protein [Myxococcota bacterium]|nr:Rieske 2Fe-2S domain-containing protein [Myxococcota bacterium]
MKKREFPFHPYPIGWFQVAYSDELEIGEIQPLSYFGEEFVIYRGEDGTARVLEAFCPHLGAHVGYGGKVDGCEIVCPFHAWKFDGTGKCTDVPYAKKIPPRARMQPKHCVEKNGVIMVWNNPLGGAPAWTLPDVPETGSDEWTTDERRRWKVKSRNQEMAENAVDTAHFHYVHGASNMPVANANIEDHVLRVISTTGMKTPRGGVDGQVESISYGFGFTTVRFTGIVETLLVNSVTPIDDEYVDVRFSFRVKKVGDANITSGVGQAFVAEVTRQLEQDIPIWENKSFKSPPLLCDGDGPIGIFRKWCKQFYPESVSQEDAAKVVVLQAT